MAMKTTIWSRSSSSAWDNPTMCWPSVAIVSTRWYARALRTDAVILMLPRTTALAVGMTISSSSRERTRQLRRARREFRRPGLAPASGLGRSLGCPSSAPAAGGGAVWARIVAQGWLSPPSELVPWAFLVLDGTVPAPLKWSQRRARTLVELAVEATSWRTPSQVKTPRALRGTAERHI